MKSDSMVEVKFALTINNKKTLMPYKKPLVMRKAENGLALGMRYANAA